MDPLLRQVDGVQLPVPDLDAGLRFYRDGLGLELKWRHATQTPSLRVPVRRHWSPVTVSNLPAMAKAAWRSPVPAGRGRRRRRSARPARPRRWP
jgi:catechol 2,3-dioxygenase-like lactoylglutathione lyase family enzyme